MGMDQTFLNDTEMKKAIRKWQKGKAKVSLNGLKEKEEEE